MLISGKRDFHADGATVLQSTLCERNRHISRHAICPFLGPDRVAKVYDGVQDPDWRQFIDYRMVKER